MQDNAPNFVEFRSFGSRLGSNYIGITGGGAISFYSGFYKTNGIKEFKNCLIMYDKNLILIGFKFGGEELGEGTYPINHNEINNTGWISAQNFFKLNPELSLSRVKGKYNQEKFKDPVKGILYVIDINKRIEVRRK